MGYQKTDWQTGDTITEVRLDHIEDGIFNNAEEIDEHDQKITNISNSLKGAIYLNTLSEKMSLSASSTSSTWWLNFSPYEYDNLCIVNTRSESSNVLVYNAYIDTTGIVRVQARNLSTTSVSTTIYVDVLYMRKEFFA